MRGWIQLDTAKNLHMSGLFSRLDEVVFRGKTLQIEIVSTIVADRGPGSAESIWGADFAIIAVLSLPELIRRKAVLGQAKRGTLDRLSAEDRRTILEILRDTKPNLPAYWKP